VGRIRHPLIHVAVVVLAGLARQRLESGDQHGATLRVELPAHEHCAIHPRAHLEAAVVDQLGLLVGVALGVGRVPVVSADVVELAR